MQSNVIANELKRFIQVVQPHGAPAGKSSARELRDTLGEFLRKFA